MSVRVPGVSGNTEIDAVSTSESCEPSVELMRIWYVVLAEPIVVGVPENVITEPLLDAVSHDGLATVLPFALYVISKSLALPPY